MNAPISILSFGISSPGGTTLDTPETFWPAGRVPEVSNPQVTRNVARVDLAAEPFNRWRMRPRLRRASALSHHLIEAVSQALEARPDVKPSQVGLVGSFFIGCLVYSVRFYKGITTEGRRFASPVLFPETVVNTPLSHVVAELGIGGPVYSQVGDTSCWVSALRTAAVWLENGDVEHVVVVGGEEFDPHFLDVMHAARWFGADDSMGVAEGAGAVLLGREFKDAIAHIARLADGFSFRTRAQAAKAAALCLGEFERETPIANTATSWMRRVAAQALSGRPVADCCGTPHFEAFTASCAWNTIRAAKAVSAGVEEKIVVPAWGLSQQISAIEISK
jgi:3-oxoacyl-[acyl-carrier-protein] synthase III